MAVLVLQFLFLNKNQDFEDIRSIALALIFLAPGNWFSVLRLFIAQVE